MMGAPSGRVNPWSFAKAASEDDKFVKNFVSAQLMLSLKTLLVIAGGIAAVFLLLVLLG